jgi:hypothetical protein
MERARDTKQDEEDDSCDLGGIVVVQQVFLPQNVTHLEQKTMKALAIV